MIVSAEFHVLLIIRGKDQQCPSISTQLSGSFPEQIPNSSTGISYENTRGYFQYPFCEVTSQPSGTRGYDKYHHDAVCSS